MRRRMLIGCLAIVLAFSLGLVGFFAFSEGKPDGLEAVLEEQNVGEQQPVWTAPLDYGSDFLSALSMGIIGFCLVLAITLTYLRAGAKKRQGTR